MWNKAETAIKDNVLKTNSVIEATFVRALNNSGKGHYIEVDLGKNIPVYDINAYFNGQDYMRNSEFVISEDGSTWTSLGEMQYVDKDGKKLASVNGEGKYSFFS